MEFLFIPGPFVQLDVFWLKKNYPLKDHQVMLQTHDFGSILLNIWCQPYVNVVQKLNVSRWTDGAGLNASSISQKANGSPT